MRGLVSALRSRARSKRQQDSATSPAANPNGAFALAEQRAELQRVAETLQTVQRHRSPILWNEVLDDVPDSVGTIVDVLRATTADESAYAAELQRAVRRFAACAQGPLLEALGREELNALTASDRLPIPPPAARERYFEGDDVSYWISGLGDRLLLLDIARRLDRPLTRESRLLDFGSSSGRVLRHFAYETPAMRAFGVDLGRRSVEWVRYHLDPAVTVLHGSVLPHLPFPDSYFHCIYAGSVFTHIADFEEAWLLELARVLAPDGFAVLTFHPERTWEEIRQNPQHFVRSAIERGPHRLDPGGIEPVSVDVFEQPMPADRVVLTLTDWPVNNANVFHRHAWIREHWGHLLDLAFIVPRAHAEYQDAAVLTRPH